MEEISKRADEPIDPRRWTVVCKHWLKGLCQKDDKCEYLHQYDLSRMPVCSSITKGKTCTAEDCVFKHIDPNSKRCPKYDMGFCIKGPTCKERHERAKNPPEYLPDKYFFEMVNPVHHAMAPLKLDSHFLPKSQQPFQGFTRYFMACGTKDTVKLAISYSAWAVQTKDLKVIREGLRQSANVALLFKDENTFYGFAKIVNDCDPSLHPGLFGNSSLITKNFRIKWIKICKLDAEVLSSYRNPFDGNNRICLSKDSQEIEPAVAEKLCEILTQQSDYRVSDHGRRY
jgi:hypothetical protein